MIIHDNLLLKSLYGPPGMVVSKVVIAAGSGSTLKEPPLPHTWSSYFRKRVARIHEVYGYLVDCIPKQKGRLIPLE